MSEESNRSSRRNASSTSKDKSKKSLETISGGALNAFGVAYVTDPYVSPQGSYGPYQQPKKLQKISGGGIETSGNDEKSQKGLSGARKRLELR